MKAQPTLICIPDISGFSEFMSDADVELSAEVIPALLNNIIYSNEIGLKVSEIEGDAVLFFKQGHLPSLEQLVAQCKLFYAAFYRQLQELKESYKNPQRVNSLSRVLGLKIILHYGHAIAPVKVGSRIKLLGEDLIIAHRLLKNKVPFREYIILSETLTNAYKEEALDTHFVWGRLMQNEEEYPHTGIIKYSYIGLGALKE